MHLLDSEPPPITKEKTALYFFTITTTSYSYIFLKGMNIMKITSIEPTPSPHSMKINVSKTLPEGETLDFKRGSDLAEAPKYIKQLFQVDGIINIFRVANFITIA